MLPEDSSSSSCGVHVVLASCVNTNWPQEEVRKHVTPLYFHEQTNTLYTRFCTWQGPLITLLCSLWVSTDKQCDDQRPLIGLTGRVGGDKDWSVSGKDWKRPELSTLEMGMKRGKHLNKGLFCPRLANLAALLITLFIKSNTSIWTITWKKKQSLSPNTYICL